MSWIDKIKTDLIIVTGDGKEYKPLWLPGEKNIEYNIASFEFPEIEGTLVNRQKQKGRKIPMQLFFQGENHIDLAADFEESAKDSRAWTLTHPYYGRLIVQPASLNIDNSGYNITAIKVELLETITEDYPKTSVDPVDKIANDTAISNDVVADNCAESIVAKGIHPLSINKSEVFLAKSNSSVQKIINQQSDTEEYYNNYYKAQAGIQDITNNTLSAITYAQLAISAPASFLASVKDRFTIISDQVTALKDTMLNGVVNLSDKTIYQTFGNTLLSALCFSASTPLPKDYANRSGVLDIIAMLLNMYNNHLATMDSLQTENGGNIDSFIPDAQSQLNLNLLVNYTVSNLFNIALSAKQQRSIILETDSNWVILAHRFYGLNTNDSTIEELIMHNNAGLNEMLQVSKNRKIIYYV